MIIQYVARDGKVFNSERECKRYESLYVISDDYPMMFDEYCRMLPVPHNHEEFMDTYRRAEYLRFASTEQIKKIGEELDELYKYVFYKTFFVPQHIYRYDPDEPEWIDLTYEYNSTANIYNILQNEVNRYI